MPCLFSIVLHAQEDDLSKDDFGKELHVMKYLFLDDSEGLLWSLLRQGTRGSQPHRGRSELHRYFLKGE